MLNRLLLSPIIFSGYNFHVVLLIPSDAGDMRVLGDRYRVVCAGIQNTGVVEHVASCS